MAKHNYISNPFYQYGSSNSKPFVYEFKKEAIPFHIYLGRESYVDMNLLCFAVDESHAKSILIEAVKRSVKEGVHNQESAERILYFLQTGENPADSNRKYRLIIEPAPVNQFYRIGWASNDNIF